MPDLDDLPGISELRRRTSGDPRVLVAVLDGVADIGHEAFVGADVTVERMPWTGESDPQEWSSAHATHIASVIFSPAAAGVDGLAPACRGLLLGAGVDEDTVLAELNIARGIEVALARGARIIHCAFCSPSQTAAPDDLLARAVRKAESMGVVIVAPAGNNYGENWCVPSALPTVLAVGALADDGSTMRFTNFGSKYEGHSIMGPGQRVHGAKLGGGTKTEDGTSVAAPVLTGIIAALTSAVLQSGRAINPQLVRTVLLDTARPCTGPGADRCIGGVVAVDRAIGVLLDGMTVDQARAAFPDDLGTQAPEWTPVTLPIPPGGEGLPPHSAARHRPGGPITPRTAYRMPEAEPSVVSPSGAEPSLRFPARAFAIGGLDVDYPDDTVRRSFIAGMGGREIDTGEAEDVERLIAYLDAHPAEARRLVWLVDINGERRYAVVPAGPYAPQAHDMMSALLLGLARGEVSVVSIPGLATGRTVSLRDGTSIPELRVTSLRSVFGWQPQQVAQDSLAAVHRDAQDGDGETPVSSDEDGVFGVGAGQRDQWPRLRHSPTPAIESAVEDFLSSVYFRAPQSPELGRERALGFASVNAYQVATAFLDAMHDDLEFADARVEFSPFARVSGECWDVIVRFADPQQTTRSAREYRICVDVSDAQPVTVGRVRRWAAPR
ncbi:MAG: S8 family serine peptidase [Candidatus Nanopelagicales bacterium]